MGVAVREERQGKRGKKRDGEDAAARRRDILA